MEKIFEVKTQLIREIYIEPIKENEDYVFFKDIKTKYVGENKVGEEGIDSGITLRSLIKDVKPNSIILLHDIYPTSVDAALQIVDAFQQKGYCFVTVEELLRLNGITPEAGQMYRSGDPS